MVYPARTVQSGPEVIIFLAWIILRTNTTWEDRTLFTLVETKHPTTRLNLTRQSRSHYFIRFI